METPRTIAVAGATGRAGRHVVDVLRGEGHNVVAMSRSNGVDVVTGEGLAEALVGVQSIIDVATSASPEQAAATEFFTVATRNLQEAGERAGVKRIVVVSIIGIDRFTGGYGAAKLVHEQAMLSGPIPAQILRARAVLREAKHPIGLLGFSCGVAGREAVAAGGAGGVASAGGRAGRRGSLAG